MASRNLHKFTDSQSTRHKTLELCHLLASLCCTVHRNKPGLQYINSIRIHGKSNAAEDGFVDGFRIQQFLKFRFSKGTNAELKLRSTLQQNAGLVVL